MRDRWAEDAGTAARAFRPAFFFISAEDSGTALEGTIILEGEIPCSVEAKDDTMNFAQCLWDSK